MDILRPAVVCGKLWLDTSFMKGGIQRSLFIIFFSFPFVSSAAASVTEIMYDLSGTDSGREWVEIQNTGTEPVSFGAWKFFEGNTNHGLSFIRGEATTSPGGFAVIADDSAKFLLDWPGFAGTLFGSNFSLGNSGETIALKLDGVVVDQVSYNSTTGGAGDGNSLQKNGSSWQAAVPTPGAAPAGGGAASVPSTPESGAATSSPPTQGAVSSTESSSPSSPSPTKTSGPSGGGGSPAFEPQIVARATVPERGVAGADVVFRAEALGRKKETLQNARFVWSFGDGATAEGKQVLHAYHYPASYAVLVEVSSGEWSATDRTDIAVAAPALTIPRIKEGPDGFIEVRNGGADEVDLSRWFLRSGPQFFAFPKSTMLPAHATVPFAAVIMKLSANPDDTALLYPNGTIAVRYAKPEATPVADSSPALAPAPLSEAADVAKPAASLRPSSSEGGDEGGADSRTETSAAVSDEAPAAPPSDLLAAAGATQPSAVWWMLGVAALVAVSVGGYLTALRSKPEPSAAERLRKEAEQFDIVE